jgi:CRISPR associated protein Cas1
VGRAAAKFEGQKRVARQLGAGAETFDLIDEATEALPALTFDRELRLVEARAAAAYWEAWRGVEVPFPTADRARVPAHWRAVGARVSLLGGSPRKAVDPVHALLNYLYAVLEAEARIALRMVGADPGLALLHADSQRRESFALDLMEPVRPKVDAYVLQLLRDHTFRRSDFFETREGVCRLMPTVARPLAATGARWAKALAPHVERAAARFAAAGEITGDMKATKSAVRLPVRFRTPLTQRNRRRPAKAAARLRAGLRATCWRCGADLGGRRRRYCDTCLPLVKRESARRGREKQEELRRQGKEKRSSREVRAARSRATKRNEREIGAWEARHPEPHDPEVFRREIAPRLKHLTGGELVEVTGLSLVYCNQIRRGARVPHPRHWKALRTLAESAPAQFESDFYAREIAPHIARFSALEIAAATGLSEGYCKRIRRGEDVPGMRWWGALAALL